MAILEPLFLPVATALRETGMTITEPVRRSGQFGAQQKSDMTLVTVADLQAQAFLTGALQRILPGCAILGEESFDDKTRWQDSPLLTTLEPVFVVDPIDGTKRYARGDDYGVMTALRRGGEVQAAWIYYPVQDEMLFASLADETVHLRWADGAMLEQPVKIARGITLGELTLHAYAPARPNGELGPYEALRGQVRAVEASECVAVEVRAMLLGKRSAQLCGCNTPWDRAPASFLVERAGGAGAVDFAGKAATDASPNFILAPSQAARDGIVAVTAAAILR